MRRSARSRTTGRLGARAKKHERSPAHRGCQRSTARPTGRVRHRTRTVRHATVRPGAAEGPYVALRRVPTRHKLRPPLGVASSPPSGIGRHGCGGLAGTLRVGGRHVARTCRSEAQGMRPEELHGVLRAHNGAGQDPERQAADQPDTALTADDLLGGGSDTGGDGGPVGASAPRRWIGSRPPLRTLHGARSAEPLAGRRRRVLPLALVPACMLGHRQRGAQAAGAPGGPTLLNCKRRTIPSRRSRCDELQRRAAGCMHRLKNCHVLMLQRRFFDGSCHRRCRHRTGPQAGSDCMLRHGVESDVV
jgi:hypothetical protein